MRHPILSRVPLVFLGTCFRWAVTRIRRTYPRFAEKEGDYTGTAEYNAER